MKIIIGSVIALVIGGYSLRTWAAVNSQKTMKALKAPVAEKLPHKLTTEFETRIDNYYWLRDKKTPKVKALLNAENKFYQQYYSAADLKLKKQIVSEIKSKIEEDQTSAPITYGEYDYFHRLVKGKNYKIHVRKNLKSGQEEILFDENIKAKNQKYFAALSKKFSPDLKYIAWCFDYDGSGKCEIELQDLTSKKMQKLGINGVHWGDIIWTANSQNILYILPNSAWRPAYLWLTNLAGKTKKIFTENNELYNLTTYLTSDQKWNLIVSGSFEQTKYFYLNNASADSNNTANNYDVQELYPSQMANLVDIDHSENGFIARSNHLQKNFGIYRFEAPGTEVKNWKEIVAPLAKAKITQIAIVDKHLIYAARSKGNDEIHHFKLSDANDTKASEAKDANTNDTVLPFNDKVYASSFYVTGSPLKVIIEYGSPLTPGLTYELNLANSELKILKEEKSPSLNANLYQTELKLVKARDGKEIPIHMVYKKQFRKKTPQPLLLYAYGSYGSTYPSDFNEGLFSLLDRGFIFVSAHVRGSDAQGEEWYDDGKLMHKKNTFNDFIDVSDYLINEKYTSNKLLGISGASAGGLLVGAVLNQKPTNFRAALAMVPFVDVLTTMLDPTMPLTTQEYLQWGNPNEKSAYEYIRSYSPYDNIQNADYPAIYVQTGINDQQVSYWEPAKWVQKIREYNTAELPVIMKVNMGAGHGGMSGRYARYEEIAERYVFLIKELK